MSSQRPLTGDCQAKASPSVRLCLDVALGDSVLLVLGGIRHHGYKPGLWDQKEAPRVPVPVAVYVISLAALSFSSLSVKQHLSHVIGKMTLNELQCVKCQAA